MIDRYTRFKSALEYSNTHEDIYYNTNIVSCSRGEKFSKAKHGQGTEIKAITYSAMQIIEQPEKSEIYVIVDI